VRLAPSGAFTADPAFRPVHYWIGAPLLKTVRVLFDSSFFASCPPSCQGLGVEPESCYPIGVAARNSIRFSLAGLGTRSEVRIVLAYRPLIGRCIVNAFLDSIFFAFFKVFFAICALPNLSFDLPSRAVALLIAIKGPNSIHTARRSNPRIFFAREIHRARYLYERPVRR
jgi:hypothetical protein